jgi:hypothetical protein
MGSLGSEETFGLSSTTPLDIELKSSSLDIRRENEG